MHPDLSPHLHTEECNAIIRQLLDCYKENPYASVFGACTEINSSMLRCIRKEREDSRAENLRKALERQERQRRLLNVA